MGLKVTELFQRFGNFLSTHQTSLVSSVLVVGSLWGESAFDSIWDCPCTISRRFTYTCLFTIAPAVFIFLVAILLDKLTWHIFQGSCSEVKCDVTNCPIWPFTQRCFGWNILLLIMRSLLAPAVWFLCIALDGRYYDCLESKVPCEHAWVNYNGTEVYVIVEAWLKQNGTDVYVERRITSQIIGWSILIVAICLVTLVTCCFRGCSKSSVLHDRYAEMQQAIESDLLEQFMKENAHHEADLNIRRFMAQRVANKDDWNQISSPPLLSVAPGTSSSPPTYTRLQQWAHASGLASTVMVGLNEMKPAGTNPPTKPPKPPVRDHKPQESGETIQMC